MNKITVMAFLHGKKAAVKMLMDCSRWCFRKHLKLPHTELAAYKIRDLGSRNTNFWLWILGTWSNLCFSSLLCHSFSFSSSWDRHASYWGTKFLLWKAFGCTCFILRLRWKTFKLFFVPVSTFLKNSLKQYRLQAAVLASMKKDGCFQSNCVS